MKRCPTCNRVENDDALAFCRVDGTALTTDLSSSEAATHVLDQSGRVAAQPTELLHRDPAEAERATANLQTSATAAAVTPPPQTGQLSKRNRTLLIIAIVLVVLIVPIAILTVARYVAYRNAGDKEVAIDSIAVLPFENLSRNADSDYLSDGVTESIINSLTQLPNLRVVARSSVFRYKGEQVDPLVAGKELGVRAVLTGRLMQSGDQVRISTELIDVRENKQLWGEQYAEKISDLLSVHHEIAAKITRSLRPRLSGEQQQRMAKRETANPEAYVLYLKGRYQTAKFTKDGLAKGLEYFDQAIALDPQYALAYDGIAANYIAAADWFMASKEAMPKAGAAAKKALELDDTLAEAHASLAIVHWWFDWDWSAAEMEFQRAIQLNPNDARAHQFYGWFLITLGRFDEAIAENKRALALDPLSVETNLLLGQSLYFARRFDEAIEQLRNTLEMDQNYWLAHSMLGRSYEQQGKLNEAIAEFQRALDLEKDVPENYSMLAHGYGVAAKKSEAVKLLEQMKDMSTKRQVPAYNLAIVYVGLGDKEQAFAWLERAYADRSFYLTWLKYDPQLDSLRSDPRFADLMRRVGLP